MTEPSTHVTIKLSIPPQTLRDLLCTAVEGGSNYWASFKSLECTEDGDYIRVRVLERASHTDGPRRIVEVTAEDLAIGIERLGAAAADKGNTEGFPTAGKHFADALDDHDAMTADVVLQMTVFGEVVYG